MLWAGLRFLTGTLIFVSIIFFPLTAGTPGRHIAKEQQPCLQPAFVRQAPVHQQALLEHVNNILLTLRIRANTQEAVMFPLPPAARTIMETASPPLTPTFLTETVTTRPLKIEPPATLQAGNAQTATEQKKGLPVEIPPAFYRLDVPDKVAITFDDGPCPGMTEKYLEVLQRYNIQSTFFVIGRQVSLYPETAKKIIAQGSEVGNHSWQHAPLDLLKSEQIMADLQESTTQLCTLLGEEILFFRPPYGRGSAEVLEAAAKLNQKLVYWNVDPRDWKNPSPENIIAGVLEQVKPGSIIILHEGRQNTLAALPGIIEGLQSRGLQPVSVSDLLLAVDWKK